jgi:glycosyltransferase involved in cell wall biosynthesis
LNTKLAVLLPVYKNDTPFYFQQAIESLLKHSIDDFLILILIDGPIGSDLGNQINLYKGNEKILINYFEVNRGLPAVLNDGIRICLGLGIDFIARMDADDISSKERLSIQYQFLLNNLNIDLVGTQSYLINANSDIIGKKKLPLFITFNGLLKNCNIVHASVMFRSGFFSKYGFYDESLRKSQDYELWLRAIKNGAVIRNLPDFLFFMRYETGIVLRRKDEQKYNIRIKKQYASFFQFYTTSWKHYLIILMPSWLIAMILKFRKLLYR